MLLDLLPILTWFIITFIGASLIYFVFRSVVNEKPAGDRQKWYAASYYLPVVFVLVMIVLGFLGINQRHEVVSSQEIGYLSADTGAALSDDGKLTYRSVDGSLETLDTSYSGISVEVGADGSKPRLYKEAFWVESWFDSSVWTKNLLTGESHQNRLMETSKYTITVSPEDYTKFSALGKD